MKFRNRPTIIEAEQFFPDKTLPFYDRGPVVFLYDGRWSVKTIHGQLAYLTPGDWVILEQNNWTLAWVCKPDVFSERYEPVEES